MDQAVEEQAMGSHLLKFAAQQKVHIETGAGQHHPVESTDGPRTDNTDARGSHVLCHGNSSGMPANARSRPSASAFKVNRQRKAP